MMAARLERHEQVSAARRPRGGLKSNHLCVGASGLRVISLADDAPVLHHQRAHHRIGACATLPLLGKDQCATHELFIGRGQYLTCHLIERLNFVKKYTELP